VWPDFLAASPRGFEKELLGQLWEGEVLASASLSSARRAPGGGVLTKRCVLAPPKALPIIPPSRPFTRTGGPLGEESPFLPGPCGARPVHREGPAQVEGRKFFDTMLVTPILGTATTSESRHSLATSTLPIMNLVSSSPDRNRILSSRAL
jgi:hypothetical protein